MSISAGDRITVAASASGARARRTAPLRIIPGTVGPEVTLDSLIRRKESSEASSADGAFLSSRDSLLRSQVASAEAFEISGEKRNLPIEAISFFTPLKGVISKEFDSAVHPWVDIAAPGGGSGSTCIWSTLPTAVEDGSGYGGETWMGTSMACPHASGVAALIVSYFGGPGFTAADARDILLHGLGGTIGGNKPVGKKLDALSSF